jgi:hypothetical protein
MFVGIGVGVNRQRFAGSFATSYSSRVIADGGTIESLECVAAASSLLQSASLLLIPSGYKAGVAYAELPANGNGDLTWSRNSVANRTQSNGSIGSVAANVPRLSYMYGSCPALLLEPQRTNSIIRSEEFDNAAWTKINTTVTANTTTSPDGNTNADTLTGNGTSSTHSVFQTASLTSGANYTISVYAKKNTNNFLQIYGFSAGYGTNSWANFDLNNGVVGSVGSSTTATITNVGSGWYRCIITIVAVSTIADAFVFNLITSATSSRAESNTLSTSVFLWGCQFEQGAYPTTYIQTTNAAATRLVDTFTRNNIYTNGLITSSGGTWFVELRNNVAYTRDNAGETLGVGDTTSLAANSFAIRNGGGSSRLQILKRVATAASTLFTTTTDIVKVAIKWNGSTADVFVNGTKEVSATSFSTTNMEFLNGWGQQIPLFIQQTALYPTPLSDAQCQTLTT